jgi:5-methylcytosine-specific restriction endonuclease McrA
LDQTPEDADQNAIEKIYKECRRISQETGIPHHVDHIVPLSKGGLHHQDNLQILTAEDNLKKSNKL